MAEWDDEGKLLSWDVTKMEVVDLEGIIGEKRIGIDVLKEWFARQGASAAVKLGVVLARLARQGPGLDRVAAFFEKNRTTKSSTAGISREEVSGPRAPAC